MRQLRRSLLLGLVVLLPGCSLIEEPGPRQLEGPTDGYLATASFLKVYVRSNSSGDLVLANFDRRDWYVSELAERVDARQVRYLTVDATPRAIMGEYLVNGVLDPEGLESLRYDKMAATAEDRERMDAEYEALLASLAKRADPEAPKATDSTPPSVPSNLPAP